MLDLNNKTFFITGVNNKKSLATAVAKLLLSEGAKVVFSVQGGSQRSSVEKIFPEAQWIVECDVACEGDHVKVADYLKNNDLKIDGFLHSIAFGRFDKPDGGFYSLEETPWEYFSEASKVSLYSLISLSNTLKPFFNIGASVVTAGISNTSITSYGYLGILKAGLENACLHLAKSFSESEVRFNCLSLGPLKTSASAGLPNYLANYHFAEQLSLRKKAVSTTEAAKSALFLLSPMSSAINATSLVVDAGMNANFFEESVVKTIWDQELKRNQ